MEVVLLDVSNQLHLTSFALRDDQKPANWRYSIHYTPGHLEDQQCEHRVSITSPQDKDGKHGLYRCSSARGSGLLFVARTPMGWKYLALEIRNRYWSVCGVRYHHRCVRSAPMVPRRQMYYQPQNPRETIRPDGMYVRVLPHHDPVHCKIFVLVLASFMTRVLTESSSATTFHSTSRRSRVSQRPSVVSDI